MFSDHLLVVVPLFALLLPLAKRDDDRQNSSKDPGAEHWEGTGEDLAGSRIEGHGDGGYGEVVEAWENEMNGSFTAVSV